jgi:hypothetical protein
MKLGRRDWLKVPNPTLGWHGVQEPGLPRRHLARIGDCSWQIIDFGHTMGPPGYPAALADMLRGQGIAMGFSNYFAGTAADVTEAGLERLVPVESDAIILQFGGQHGMRRLLGSTGPRTASLALWANSRAGSLGGLVHRHVTGPALNRWGRSYWPEHENVVRDDDVRRVLSWLAEHRPGVPCAMLSAHPVRRSGWADPLLVDQATERYMRIAQQHGVFVLDYRMEILGLLDSGQLRERDVFGATGYDLRAAGQRVIADGLRDWLGTRWLNGSDAPWACRTP